MRSPKCVNGITRQYSVFGIGYIKHQSCQITNGVNFKFLRKKASPFSGPAPRYPTSSNESQHISTCRPRAIDLYYSIPRFTVSYPSSKLFKQLKHFLLCCKSHASTTVNFRSKAYPVSKLFNICKLERSIHFQPCCQFHSSSTMKFKVKEPEEDDKKGLSLAIKLGAFCVVVCVTGYLAISLTSHKKKSEPTVSRAKEELSEKLQEEFEKPEADKLTLSLQITECELYLRRGKEEESFQRVKDVVLKRHPLLEIVKLARALIAKDRYFHALILFYIIHVPVQAFEEIDIPPREILVWISDRITDVGMAVRPLIKLDPPTHDVAVKYGLKYMEKLLSDYRSVKHTDAKFTALTEACCLHNIAFINIELGDYKIASEIANDGLALLDKHLNETAANNIYHGALLNDLGIIHERLDKWSDAEQYYDKALKSYETVDINEVPLIQEHIAITEFRLAAVRKRLGKL